LLANRNVTVTREPESHRSSVKRPLRKHFHSAAGGIMISVRQHLTGQGAP
jgi:hypothetical protein